MKRRPKGCAKQKWPLLNKPLRILGAMLATSLAQCPKENCNRLPPSQRPRTMVLRFPVAIGRLRVNAESGFLIVRPGISPHRANARSYGIGFRWEPIWYTDEFLSVFWRVGDGPASTVASHQLSDFRLFRHSQGIIDIYSQASDDSSGDRPRRGAAWADHRGAPNNDGVQLLDGLALCATVLYAIRLGANRLYDRANGRHASIGRHGPARGLAVCRPYWPRLAKGYRRPRPEPERLPFQL
ncbi:hypothetical protein EMIT0194MI4_40511 [Pseudomonas sp. IT-194MI4]